jgi:hypothetical protein
MARGPHIVRPTSRQDRPSPLGLVAIAAVALVTGLALTRASAEGIRLLPAPRIERVSGAAPPADRDADAEAAHDEAQPEPVRRISPVVPPSGPAITSQAEVPSEAIARAAGPAPHPADLGTTSLAAPPRAPERHPSRRRVTVETGRVAYLRCDGAEAVEGLFPCPRDRALEQRAWSAILALGTCHDLAASDPTAVGRADAWLIFTGPALDCIRMRESPGAEPVSNAIRTCLEERLAGLRSAAGAERMTVSFRFELE